MDVNVVLAAFHADHPKHAAYRGWFDALVADAQGFGVPMMVWWSVLRLATNPRVFSVPASVGSTLAFAAAVRAQPTHRVTEPGPRHLDLVAELAAEADASGDLFPDVVLAAIARENGAAVATADRDFRRFDTITVSEPE